MNRRRPRGLRPEEEALWDKIRQSAVPLHPEKKQAVVAAIKNLSKPKAPPVITQFRIGQSPAPKPIMPRPAKGPLSMDHKHFGRMKKGKLSPEARIDLHGMTTAQAHPALIGFILGAHQRRQRLVLVITGKGRAQSQHQPMGILRHQVPHWLELEPLRSAVLQVSQSHLKHGGDGALYVYLRRQK